MDNLQFLNTLKKSFITYLQTHARSNKKLEILHGAISKDLKERLDDQKFSVYSLGHDMGKEHRINGRYIDKTVDITINENNVAVAGIAVKFVMSNYSQNSNNYFENMLGETANIRSAKIPYFQIFVIPDKIPYFNKDGDITKWEKPNEHNLKKYIKLSNDDIDSFLHTPNKTLLYIVHIQETNPAALIQNRNDYKEHYLHNSFEFTALPSQYDFGNSLIYNDYNKFIQKVAYAIKSL